jgi:hypothetical protein
MGVFKSDVNDVADGQQDAYGTQVGQGEEGERPVQPLWSEACRTAKAAASVRRCMPSLASSEDT